MNLRIISGQKNRTTNPTRYGKPKWSSSEQDARTVDGNVPWSTRPDTMKLHHRMARTTAKTTIMLPSRTDFIVLGRGGG